MLLPRFSTPLVWLYCPVRIAAREGLQTGSAANAWVKRTPEAAIASIVGVWMMPLPFAPNALNCWSSVKISTTLGCGVVCASAAGAHASIRASIDAQYLTNRITSRS